MNLPIRKSSPSCVSAWNDLGWVWERAPPRLSGEVCGAMRTATDTDKDKRDPVHIQMPIYFNFKGSLEEESNKSAFYCSNAC